jgi:NhaP-type Na+/H+ or K+/H+ antiporter
LRTTPLSGRSKLIEPFVALAAIGGLLLILGLFAGLIHESGLLSEPLFALLAGVLVGPGVFALLDLSDLGEQVVVLEYAALVTLAVALMGVALRLPIGYISSNWRLLVVLLGILM